MDKQVWTINNYRRRTCSQGGRRRRRREEGRQGGEGGRGRNCKDEPRPGLAGGDCLANWFLMTRLRVLTVLSLCLSSETGTGSRDWLIVSRSIYTTFA